MLSEKPTDSDIYDHAKILVKNKHEQKLYLKIPNWYLEKYDLEFNPVSINVTFHGSALLLKCISSLLVISIVKSELSRL